MKCDRCSELKKHIELLNADLENAEKDLRKQRRALTALHTKYSKLFSEHPSAPDVKAVLTYWQQVISPTSKIPLDGIRAQKVLARLRDYTVWELCRAIDGCAQSDWHMGRDPKTQGKAHNDLELICRDEAHVDRFIARYCPPSARELFARLEDLKQISVHEFEARCPAHQDDGRSLSVVISREGLGFSCSKGCRREAIRERLGPTASGAGLGLGGPAPRKFEGEQDGKYPTQTSID